jgi:hypothetical protein
MTNPLKDTEAFGVSSGGAERALEKHDTGTIGAKQKAEQKVLGVVYVLVPGCRRYTKR